MKRATMKDIANYDWFKKDLPCYLFPDPDDEESSIIDADAIKEVERKFCVTEAEVHSALLGGDPQDPLRIAYHLIVDNKRIADETNKLEIRVSLSVESVSLGYRHASYHARLIRCLMVSMSRL